MEGQGSLSSSSELASTSKAFHWRSVSRGFLPSLGSLIGFGGLPDLRPVGLYGTACRTSAGTRKEAEAATECGTLVFSISLAA